MLYQRTPSRLSRTHDFLALCERAKDPNFTELGAGEIGGLTLVPGLYKWGTGVSISKNVTLAGGSSDVWIFQIAGSMTQASATKVILAGGALAKNVFWQAADVVSISRRSSTAMWPRRASGSVAAPPSGADCTLPSAMSA